VDRPSLRPSGSERVTIRRDSDSHRAPLARGARSTTPPVALFRSNCATDGSIRLSRSALSLGRAHETRLTMARARASTAHVGESRLVAGRGMRKVRRGSDELKTTTDSPGASPSSQPVGSGASTDTADARTPQPIQDARHPAKPGSPSSGAARATANRANPYQPR